MSSFNFSCERRWGLFKRGMIKFKCLGIRMLKLQNWPAHSALVTVSNITNFPLAVV